MRVPLGPAENRSSPLFAEESEQDDDCCNGFFTILDRVCCEARHRLAEKKWLQETRAHRQPLEGPC